MREVEIDSAMRICSLFPSATEIVGALGLVDSLVGVSYECDFPPDVRGKPVVVNTRLPATDDPAEIDEHVREFFARGESLYRIEGDILRKGEPDLILTQELCNVCAATPGDLGSALKGSRGPTPSAVAPPASHRRCA